MTSSRKQRGVVLLVVLSILATIGLLLLQVSLTARDEVAKAQILVDRAEASLRVRTEESRLQLALLTHPWLGPDPSSDDPRVQRWNFEGAPFDVGDTRFEVQDVGGLFVVPQPGYNSGLAWMPELFDRLGVEQGVARRAIDEFARRIGPQGAAPIQDVGELAGYGGLSRGDVERLRAVSTLYPVQRFNPVTAPPPVLASLYKGSNREAILALRTRRELNPSSFARVVGDVDTDLTAFFPGPAFRIVVRVRRGEVEVARESVVVLDPYADQPVERWSTRRAPRALVEAR